MTLAAMKALGSLLVVYVFLAFSLPFPVVAQPNPVVAESAGTFSDPAFADIGDPTTCDGRSFTTLRIERQPQVLLHPWCWAAATHNVTEYVYYRNKPLQSQAPYQCEMAELMAQDTPRNNTCCDPVGQWDGACQRTHWPEQILDLLHFSYSPPLVLDPHDPDDARMDDSYWPIDWSHVKRQICSKQPYISIIETSQDSHAVVVHGFLQLPLRLQFLYYGRAAQVYDPASNDSYFDFGRYSSLTGRSTGVTSHGEQHYGDTYDIKKIPAVIKLPERTPTPADKP
jgi:hypothetical protein